MELPKRVTLNYSLKNIPIPPADSYKKKLMERTKSVIKRMRWRAFFYLNNESNEEDEHNDEECYWLKSHECPPQVEELKPFEDDMMKLIEGATFRKSCIKT